MPDRTDSLCICLTPLHVLIAGRIAALRGEPFSQGVYLTSADNAKNRHYAEVMHRFCVKSEYLIVPGEESYGRPRQFAIWMRRWRFRRAFRRFGPVGTIHVPSSLNHYIYMFLSAFGFRELRTFDDGLINVQRDSPLARWRTRPIAKAFFLTAGVTYWPERIRASASRHYSIYDVGNVCSRVMQLRLIGEEMDGDTGHIAARPVRLFLGPAPEAGDSVWTTFAAASRKINPDAYFPHPRDTRPKLEGVPILATPLVAEDYILSQLSADPAIVFEIYGYDSSALVNLARTSRVKAFSFLGGGTENAGLRKLMESSGVVMLVQSREHPDRRATGEKLLTSDQVQTASCVEGGLAAARSSESPPLSHSELTSACKVP